MNLIEISDLKNRLLTNTGSGVNIYMVDLDDGDYEAWDSEHRFGMGFVPERISHNVAIASLIKGRRYSACPDAKLHLVAHSHDLIETFERLLEIAQAPAVITISVAFLCHVEILKIHFRRARAMRTRDMIEFLGTMDSLGHLLGSNNRFNFNSIYDYRY